VAIAYISLGSNVGDREAHLHGALAQLGTLGKLRQVSSFYDTAPVGLVEQPRFLNAVTELDTELPPERLMRVLLEVEIALGRDRKDSVPKGPRTIDLDLLLYDQQVLDTPELTLPHPAMHERAFVLGPLVEIAPNAFHPVFMRSARQLLDALQLSLSS
jgi:2-amino-4-hydroxy-6-hydroxymethyldihydropteridine diphosphokinase